MAVTRFTGCAIAVTLIAGCSSAESTLGRGWTPCGTYALQPYRTREDPRNCGGCGIQCGAGESCNDGVCGADRNYALWPLPVTPLSSESYLLSDGIAVDNSTRLNWQRGTSQAMLTRQEARQYCYELGLEGGGWRLPTSMEMLTLVDYSRTRPAIELTTFQNTPPAGVFWVTERPSYPEGSVDSIGWDFTEGRLTGLLDTEDPMDPHDTAWARCVRSEPPASRPEHYIVSDETVLDTGSRLRWQQTSPPTEEIREGDDGQLYRWQIRYTQEGAEEYCSQLSLGPYADGWRVPSINELQTLFRTSPKLGETGLDPVAFPIDSDHLNQLRDYWSSTRYVGAPGIPSGWVASLEASPYISTHDPGSGLRVRCVRGPEP